MLTTRKKVLEELKMEMVKLRKRDVEALMMTEEEIRTVLETMPFKTFDIYKTLIEDEHILAGQYILEDIEESGLDLQLENRPMFTRWNSRHAVQLKTGTADSFMRKFGIEVPMNAYVYIEHEDIRPSLIWSPITKLFEGDYSDHKVVLKQQITSIATIKDMKWKSFRKQYLMKEGRA